MTDTNRPIAYHVIDEREPRSIVATFDTLHRAQSFCEKMEPDAAPRTGYRFVVEPVRPHVNVQLPQDNAENGRG